MGEKAATVRKFLDSFEIPLSFDVVLDPDQSISRQWGVSGLPTSIIIGKDKERKLTWQGPREWDSDEAISLIETWLDG